MRNGNFEFLGIFLFFAVIVSLGIWWQVSVWNECREEGRSFMYCWNLVSRR